MVKSWKEIRTSEKYQKLDSDTQFRIQKTYYDEYIKTDSRYQNADRDQKRVIYNAFFKIPTNKVNTVAEQYVYDKDLSDDFSVMTEAERQQEIASGPIDFVEAAARTYGLDLLPFSPTGVVRTAKIKTAVDRLKKDQYANDWDRQRDRDQVKGYLYNIERERLRGYTWGAKVFKNLAMLPGFMLEFLATGGIASLGRKAVTKGVAKVSEKAATKLATKGLALAVGGAMRAPVMYNRYVPKYAERQIAANVAITDKGDALLQESKEKPAISFAKAFGDVVIETISEESGVALTKGFQVVGRGVGHVFPKKLGKAIMKVYKKIKPSGKISDMFTKAGFNGVLEEIGEERLGDVMRAVTGIEVAPGEKEELFQRLMNAVPDMQQLSVEAAVFSVPGVANFTTQKLYNRLVKLGKNVSFEEVDTQLSQIEKDKMEDDLKDLDSIKSIVTDEELDAEIKRDEIIEKLDTQEISEIAPEELDEIIKGKREFDRKFGREEFVDQEQQEELSPQIQAVKEEITKVEKAIAGYEEKGEEVPSSLLKRKEQVLTTLGLPKNIATRKGISVGRILGNYTKNITVNEAQMLKRILRAESAAAKTAFKIGKQQERERLTSLFRSKTVQVKSLKNSLVKYIKESLPTKDSLGKPINSRGKMLSLVEKVNTQAGLQKAFERVNQEAINVERQNVIKDIKNKSAKALNSQVLDVGYKEQVQDLIDLVDFTKISKPKLQKLRKLETFIKNKLSEGKDVELPSEVFNTLDRLYKTSAADMTLSELQLLKDNINDLIEIGRLKKSTRNKLNTLRAQRILRDLEAQGTASIETIKQELPALGETLSAGAKIRNVYYKALGGAQHLGEVIMPMDYFFDYLDNLKNYSGVLYNNFKKRIDLNYRNYIQQKTQLSEEIAQYINQNKLNEQNFQRVGVYAINRQENGRQKLINTGITEKEIDDLKLTKKELGLYNIMRKRLDKLAPQIADMLRVVYNRPFGKVKNYFSFLTDYEAMNSAELANRYEETDLLLDMLTDKAEEYGQNQKNPNLKFTEKRMKGVKQKVKINALDVYMQHIDKAAYAINMSESLKLLNIVNRSDQMRKLIGDKGQEYLNDWIKTLAKNGVRGDTSWLDALRRNISAAQFGYKIFTTILQSTAILDGASKIGIHAFRGMTDIAISRKARKFVLDNFVEIKNRIGGDAEFLEMGSTTSFEKFKNAGFYALKKVDGMTAASIAFGSYRRYLSENNIPLDFNNPNKEAIIYAEKMVRLTQASAQAKDLPLALMSKQLTGSVSLNRALFQFQTFLLTRWQIIRHELGRYGIQQGDIGKGMNVLFWLMMANFAEYGLRVISNQTLNVLFDKDEEEEENIGLNMAMTMLGNVPYVSSAVSFFGYGSNPIPTFDIMGKMVDAVVKAKQSEAEQTKLKWLIRFTTDTLAAFKGVPKTFGKWAEKFIEMYE
jgi:hypothetical protein